MPRRKRSDKISEFHLQALERKVELLRLEMREAMISLTPFWPHYDAILEMSQAMTKALNLLNDRPAEYEEPYRGPMQG